MGIFGAARKGFGMLGKARAKKKMLSGTSTRAERLKHGERSPDIKKVPVSPSVKKYKQSKIARGESTRADRIKYGKRDKDIKSVPVSADVKKGDVKESIRKGKQHFYIKNIDEVTKHVTDIKKGKKAVKKLKHMRDTNRAFKIGKKKTFPHDPAAGPIKKEFKEHN